MPTPVKTNKSEKVTGKSSLNGTKAAMLSLSAKTYMPKDAKELVDLVLKRAKADPNKIFDIAIRSWVDTWADEFLTDSEKEKYEKIL